MKSIDRIPTSKLQRASKIVTTGAKLVLITSSIMEKN